MNILMVGGGKKIHFLIKKFTSKGYNVVIINRKSDYAKQLARKHPNVTVVLGDGTDPTVLEDAGIQYANMVIAMTPDDPDNLVICQIAERMHNVPKKFAVVNDPQNVEIFKKLGVDTVISTVEIISSIIEQRVSVDDILNIFSIEEGQLTAMQLKIGEDAIVLDKKLSELDFPRNAIVGAIIRDEKPIIPKGNTEIRLGDSLIILTLIDDQSKVIKTIKGKVE
jgi:trk system potassium uptake protein TrkA